LEQAGVLALVVGIGVVEGSGKEGGVDHVWLDWTRCGCAMLKIRRWLGPDIIVLNPQIPLEIFLPPEDFKHTNFVGTHDSDGLNGGAFFLRVDDWSVQMLVEVIAPPREPSVNIAELKDEKALETVLRGEKFREGVVYQPRTWFNAYQLSADRFEGKRGDLLVHFHDLEGDKWPAMQQTLEKLSDHKVNSTWSVPLRQTTYEQEVLEFWDRMRKGKKLLELAEKEMGDGVVKEAAEKLSWTIDYLCDQEREVHAAMDRMKAALGITEGEKVA